MRTRQKDFTTEDTEGTEATSDAIPLTLTRSEALVLFEWLAAAESENALPIPDEAEQQVLWNVEALLEKSLWEVFSSKYDELLASAKNEILNAGE